MYIYIYICCLIVYRCSNPYSLGPPLAPLRIITVISYIDIYIYMYIVACVYIYIYTHREIHICTYVYVYIYRERERDTYMYIHVCLSIYRLASRAPGLA